MKHERRYIVIKIKDAEKYLSDDGLENLWNISENIDRLRQSMDGKKPLDCVVVESDWPEFKPTWEAIEKRVDAKERPICKWTVIEEGYKTDCGGIIEDFQGDIYCPNCGGKVDRTGVNFKKTAEEIVREIDNQTLKFLATTLFGPVYQVIVPEINALAKVELNRRLDRLMEIF